MKNIYKENGTLITTHEEIKKYILELYGTLMVKADTNMKGIDIIVMREGPRITNEKRYLLEEPVT